MKRYFLIFCCVLLFVPCLLITSSASEPSQNQQVLDVCDHYSLDPADVGFFIQYEDRGDLYTYVFLTEDLPSPYAFEWRSYTEAGSLFFRLYPTNVQWYRLMNDSFASDDSSINLVRRNFLNAEAIDGSGSVLVYSGTNDPYFFFHHVERLTLLQILPQADQVQTKISQMLTILVPSGVLILALILSVILLKRFSTRFAQ